MTERVFLSTIVGLVVASWAAAGQSAGRPAQAAGTMKVRVVDEAGRLLPARVHLRDAECRYLLAPGHETRQRAMHDKTGPMCGDWFYTDGEFSIEVGAGETQIDIAHGPEYVQVTVPFVENKAVRHALEAMCRDALAKCTTQAELR